MNHEADTVALLTEWGKWSRGGYGDLRARSPMAVTMQLVEAANNRTVINISDENALRVEASVSSLRLFDVIGSDAIELRFIQGLGETQVALRMKLSLVRTQKALARAIGYVDCYLKNIASAA